MGKIQMQRRKSLREIKHTKIEQETKYEARQLFIVNIIIVI